MPKSGWNGADFGYEKEKSAEEIRARKEKRCGKDKGKCGGKRRKKMKRRTEQGVGKTNENVGSFYLTRSGGLWYDYLWSRMEKALQTGAPALSAFYNGY